MIGVDMKGLIEKCNGFCTQALHSAAGYAVTREHYEVTFEHFLLACLEEEHGDAPLLLGRSGCDIATLRRELQRSLSLLRSGNTGRPVFSPTLQDVLEAGWLVSSVDLGAAALRSGGVLLAFLRRPGFYAQGDYPALLRSLDSETLLRDFARLTDGTCETDVLPSAGAADVAAGPAGQGGESFLARFCEDFTEKARAGKLDPVFGRDQEIRQMVDILARRRKNNPILVGEPGVGKTAVMEGLALRISEGDVPETLRGTTLLSLDMGLLEAGASVKGEFERRLKGVLDEIKASEKSIILFIDEAHLLVGAGNGAGGSDAANLMKPALARGEIRTCAATTWKEYKKYFEKDAALARRFQLVRLDEPSVETTGLILRGLRAGYEAAHKVLVRDEALQAAADYAGRYISGRFLPDKAVDLLDTACARVKVSQVAKPGALEDAERRAQACRRQLDALERDAAEGADVDESRCAALRDAIAAAQAEAEALNARWQEEKTLAQAVLDARAALADARSAARDAEGAAEPDATDAVAAAGEALRAAREALAARQDGSPLVGVEVTADVVAQVVSDWTGIPVGKVARDQAGQIAGLAQALAARIRGQDMALRAVVEGIQAGKAGLRAPEQPLGVFLLVGPSGVGKTETGLALADALFGDERSVITVNMSEFQEKHTVSRLIGSPPGYVGYGEGGLLTEAVRRRPYAVVLLDEVEKAHPDVMQLFYQVFDKGTLTDGEGTEVSFRNTVIMLTSNLGSEITQALCEGCAEPPALETVAAALRPLLSSHFQPALLARMHVVPYLNLGEEMLASIAGLKLQALARRMAANNGMRCTWSDGVPQWLASRCTETETGARNIDYVLAGTVLPDLARRILAHMAGDCPPQGVHLDIRDNELVMEFDGASPERTA
ncbi:MAG TPA: type VI secretion system ATPase TssH [Candidatus Desulfovibrio gallistercoris]|uniref:type VI secretion system ATPase TssH n=1 Tax=uncultured Desulfovibrio sp. TaxID=167968 RepID=UPI001F85E68F|nr:type VI secretion system ATPase TssH [uncultured Desulfovibrio sp.]HJA75662.1 type VI secretion system ATPase TssH [Candidatus Desulfovibrio gallistercoris]